MTKKAILTAAITGAVHVPSMSPHLPITPDEIVQQSVDACKAGAAVVHLHGRDPKTGAPSSDLALMREVVSEIKKRCDVIINISTGASQMMSTEERLAAGSAPQGLPKVAVGLSGRHVRQRILQHLSGHGHLHPHHAGKRDHS